MRNALLVVALLCGNVAARAQDGSEAVVARAVKAHGGEERLARARAERMTAQGTLYQGDAAVPFSAETTFQPPRQFKNVLRVTLQGKPVALTQVMNGEEAWVGIDGKVTKPDEAGLAQLKEAFHLDQVTRLAPLLKDRDRFKLTSVGETRVEGRPSFAVKVETKGLRDVRLYFDKESGLLVKAEHMVPGEMGKEVLEEQFYAEQKPDAAGAVRATKVVVLRDGKKRLEGKLTDVKYLDKVPDSEFAKP
jgi:hypothetical protein